MSFELVPLKPEQHSITFIPKLATELPFFNLTSRRKDIPKVIKYQGRDAAGRPFRWEVYQDTSKEIGAPAVEAHEVWYLLVKPAIDSQRQPNGKIPEIVPLGGMRECLRKVGWTIGGHQAHELIKALTQIAFAGCVADLWVPTGERDAEGKERFLQIKGRFSRMSVYAIGEHHLTEEELSTKQFEFDLEDVLYIRLDPLEVKLQQFQDQRVFDNEYLFSVSPAARRWYELMAAKIFGVVKNKGQFCEIRYSWYVQHHHTLKRHYERFRVVEQMKRVTKDHLESGYIKNVEYRAIKEPDQEIDYIIRYYPGEGARESIARIQGHIHRKKNQQITAQKPAGSSPEEGEQGRTAQEPEATETVALALITAEDVENQQLVTRLVTEFGIAATKALELVKESREAVIIQLEAWPFRETQPRNRAGWMIQAIEGNYAAPLPYLQDKLKQKERQQLEATQAITRACTICEGKGYRLIKSDKYPSGAMKKCTHDLAIESKIQSA
jgi:hypothetical protein